MEKEYIVSLKRGVDYETFNQEMIANTGAGAIPNRSATVANARPGSERNTHYMLTDAEAETLRQDPRVYGVELNPLINENIVIERRAVQLGEFSKTTLDRGDFINWGLRRMNETTNPYDSEGLVEGGYNYTLDGSGVDIVIQDSGIQADHPEFFDSEGNSRVQQINWFTESGLPGTMPAGHYTDYHGHGTHCAGIAASKTYGWAKNARIYAVKVDGLEGSADPNNGILVSDCFDVIKEWHNNKPIDPATGYKRPTIVNMSWGYSVAYDSILGINYRGSNYTGGSIVNPWQQFGVVPYQVSGRYRVPYHSTSVDVDVQEMVDAGIHVCIAAGNSYFKIDVFGGVDYNNNVVTNTGTYYYHRGSSPLDDEAHIVGNIDSELHTGGLEQKAESSNSGPGVSIWAPGTNIMSACSNVNELGGDGPYPANTDFKIANISGTSMASPNVAGMLALYCQLNPNCTPAQAKAFVGTRAATSQIYSTSNSNDYDNTRSILGSDNKFAYNKFNSSAQLTIGPRT